MAVTLEFEITGKTQNLPESLYKIRKIKRKTFRISKLLLYIFEFDILLCLYLKTMIVDETGQRTQSKPW